MSGSPASADAQAGDAKRQEKIDKYEPRLGRSKPLIAVVGLNEGTETIDFMVPFGILARSGVAEVVSVATSPGPVVSMVGKLKLQLQSTIDEFDRRHPEGADYVIIPNTQRNDDPNLVKWVAAQSQKGGTLVSICIGAMVVANTGLLDGRRATSYYSTEQYRGTKFPNVKWQSNVRYVADGKFVSSAGITAAIPTSIALVEAIAGRVKAAALASDLGVADWSSDHNSDVFQKNPPAMTRPDANHDVVAIPIREGDDEIVLALTADAYSFTGRSQACVLSTSSAPVRLKYGLAVIPNRVTGDSERVTRVLPPLTAEHPVKSLDASLDDITNVYGRTTAESVARILEYPGLRK